MSKPESYLSDRSLLFLLEPTGKIVPKVPGRKYDGGVILIQLQNQTAFVLCDVVGYPIPLYR